MPAEGLGVPIGELAAHFVRLLGTGAPSHGQRAGARAWPRSVQLAAPFPPTVTHQQDDPLDRAFRIMISAGIITCAQRLLGSQDRFIPIFGRMDRFVDRLV